MANVAPLLVTLNSEPLAAKQVLKLNKQKVTLSWEFKKATFFASERQAMNGYLAHPPVEAPYR